MSAKHLLRWLAFFVCLAFVLPLWARGSTGLPDISVADLPYEAQVTLLNIKQNRPLPYAKDGVVFGNYEGVLPKRKRGYYHEYTVKTPGARNRGPKRIVAGGEAGQRREYFYTDDHYVSFKRIRE
jgi:ribonuclease T1